MRLQLDPAPLEVVASADDGGGDQAPPRRTIAGVAVPYGVEAKVGHRWVTFAADSVTPADAGPLLLGHDTNRPVGVLVVAEQTPAGLRGRYAIDATLDGDTALVQAQSGSRRGLSVGVEVETFDQDPDDPDRITVTAGRLAETSLVTLAAFTGAGVDQIAAHKQEDVAVPDEAQTIAATAPPADSADADARLDVQADAPRRPPLIITQRDAPEMRLGEYVQTLIRAERGDQDARVRIEAALTRGNITTSPGVVPATYVAQMVDGLGDPRTLYDAFDHADMPAAGMSINRPVIATRPDGNWLADDTAGAPSGAVAINNLPETIRQWAWGGSASVALVERSSPSYVEEVFAQAIKSYHRDVEADLATFLPAATGGPASLGAAVGAFMTAYRRAPSLLICGATAYGKLIDAKGDLTFSTGSVDSSGQGTVAGLRAIASADVAAADAWVTLPELVESRESAPIRLSVSDVTSLSLEIGVTSFYASLRTLPTSGGVAGAVGIPGFTPTGLEGQTAKSKS